MGRQLDKGVALYRAGQAAEAAKIFEGICTRDRDDGYAAFLLGVARLGLGENARAAQALKRAVTCTVKRPPPYRPEIFRALGEAHDRLGQDGEALDAYMQAAALVPSDAAIQLALGAACLRLGQADRALAAFDRVVAAEPRSAAAHNNRGLALKQLGDGAAAEAAFAAALDADPGFALAAFNRGKMLRDRQAMDDAEPHLRQALLLSPGFTQAKLALADLLRETARPIEARALLDSILAADPTHAVAAVWRPVFELPVLYRDCAELEASRTAYARQLDRLAERMAPAPGRFLDGFASTRPFLLAYQGQDDRALQTRYGALLSACVADAVRQTPSVAKPRDRRRIGIVSGCFRDHSVWKIPTRGWLEALAAAGFETIGYHVAAGTDSRTDEARAFCHRFEQGPRALAAWVDRIGADRCDALLYPEIGMDPMALQLAALRLAPLQINGLGHPVTSGLATMDLALSSGLMEPPEAQDHYTEELVRLPHLGMTYEPPATDIATTTREALGLATDTFAFWCPQSLFKYRPDLDGIFADIAVEVARASFVFIGYQGGDAVTQVFASRLARVFARRGLSMERHCRFLPRMSQPAFVAAAGRCDAMLDGLGWSGFNSTLESLTHDLPIVAFEGSFMRGRHSAAILKILDLEEMIADTPARFVSQAVRLAKDPAFRADVRRRIAERKSRLVGHTSPMNAMIDVLRRRIGPTP